MRSAADAYSAPNHHAQRHLWCISGAQDASERGSQVPRLAESCCEERGSMRKRYASSPSMLFCTPTLMRCPSS